MNEEAEEKEKGKPDSSQARRFIQRQGGDVAAVVLLMSENKGYRDEIRDLKTKLPAEGAVALTGDDATAWEAYRALGKPEDVAAVVTERDTLKAETDSHKRRATFREAAELLKWHPAVFEREAEHDGLAVEFEGEGESRKAVAVRDGQKTALAEYATSHWKDLLPALQVSDNGRRMTPFPAQHGSGATAKTGLVAQRKERLQAKASAPNALTPSRGLTKQP